ncbi:nucleoside phosphorylase [Fusarium denticulatum]|uniref:Nucleoside phosphorylase n=1 Tax=Fusarium denticulatum TaxID=48507 RepID=A0A8H5XH55_9HYPO|nr:nucleoside phosphorylase [Fusarium denticulatum]
MPRKDLEGWDFEDLSANRDPLNPRLVTLESAGKGWVDLTRDLQAVTMVGSGFGELIRPAGPTLCGYWSQLPRHRYLLACSISDMEDVIRDHRSSESDHARLSDNLIWHNAVDISGKCQCGSDAGYHGEPVHVAFPSALSRKLCPSKSSIKLSGAAVFGHNPGFSWTWGDTGLTTQQQSEHETVVIHQSDKADNDNAVAGKYGTNAAASAMSDMRRNFESIQFCLLVGIAGGTPSEDNNIRLGDVVVSLPTQTFPGVIQYDLGKENEGSGFERTGTLRPPPRIFTNAISKLRSDPDIEIDALNPHLTKIMDSLPAYKNPGPELDRLFRAACTRRTCKPDCTHLEQRLPRPTVEPMIHYGLVASGNRVVKDATFRDRLSRKYGMLCFEMEAAGVGAGCLVIRGICDYSDAQKNKV